MSRLHPTPDSSLMTTFEPAATAFVRRALEGNVLEGANPDER
jgi:hypothetical protein